MGSDPHHARGTPGSAAALLQLVRNGRAMTRRELGDLAGVSRSVVTQRVDALLAAGLLREAGTSASTGGRPASRLRFNGDAAYVLVADLGATHGRIAVTDLDGEILAEQPMDQPIADGPELVLDRVREHFDALLDQVGRDRAVWGIGIGVPGPVEHATGRAVSPPIMPGWDGYSIADHLGDLGVPVLVDNDVNIMALGEYSNHWRGEVDDLLLIKVGTGIGCGIVASGRIHRGAQGAAGDLGHVQVHGYDDVVCSCGNTGCVEAIASGQALAEQLTAAGHPTPDARAVVRRVQRGDSEATRKVREAGQILGEVVATAVNLFNPSVIVIAGDLSNAREQLLAGVREVVYQRSLPLATRHLQVVPPLLGDRAGIRGAGEMVVERLLSDDAVDDLLDRVLTERAGAGG